MLMTTIIASWTFKKVRRRLQARGKCPVHDENADETKDILKTDPRSALSGSTIEELAEN